MRPLLLAVALVCLPTTCALASRAPTRAENREIRAAARTSHLTSLVGCFHTVGVRVSTAGPWAKGIVRPCVDGATDALNAVFENGRGRWRLRALGFDAVGCGAPRAVIRDLRLRC